MIAETMNPALSARLTQSRQRNLRRKIVNAIMLALTGAATFLAIVPLIWILYSVISNGAPALTADFFTQTFAPTDVGGGGILHGIVGSAMLIGLACLMAIPIGVLGAFYISENGNTPFGLAVRFGTDVLSGLPSIVVGLFVYTLFVAGRGYTAIAGAVALAIMMLPVVVRTTEEMLKLVPRSLKEASLGLGAPVWKTSLAILLPAALTGIMTGVMLAIARVFGETAPLLFTAQGNNLLSTNLGEPIAALPLILFKYATDPDPVRNTQAWGISFIIVLLVLILNIGARLLTSRHPKSR